MSTQCIPIIYAPIAVYCFTTLSFTNTLNTTFKTKSLTQPTLNTNYVLCCNIHALVYSSQPEVQTLLLQPYVIKCIIWSGFSIHALAYNKYCVFRRREAGEHALTERKITLVCTNDSHSELQDWNNGNFFLHSFIKQCWALTDTKTTLNLSFPRGSLQSHTVNSLDPFLLLTPVFSLNFIEYNLQLS